MFFYNFLCLNCDQKHQTAKLQELESNNYCVYDKKVQMKILYNLVIFLFIQCIG